MKTFPITNCQEWSYTTKTHTGVCVVDGEKITMKFKVVISRPVEVPDVLAIEEFCRAMGKEKATLEGYAAKLLALFAEIGSTIRLMAKGHTRTHGNIMVVLSV